MCLQVNYILRVKWTSLCLSPICIFIYLSVSQYLHVTSSGKSFVTNYYTNRDQRRKLQFGSSFCKMDRLFCDTEVTFLLSQSPVSPLYFQRALKSSHQKVPHCSKELRASVNYCFGCDVLFKYCLGGQVAGGWGWRGRDCMGQWTHDAGCRWCFLELNTWNTCGLVNQWHPINSIKN